MGLYPHRLSPWGCMERLPWPSDCARSAPRKFLAKTAKSPKTATSGAQSSKLLKVPLPPGRRGLKRPMGWRGAPAAKSSLNLERPSNPRGTLGR